jgi:hypothetical protein
MAEWRMGIKTNRFGIILCSTCHPFFMNAKDMIIFIKNLAILPGILRRIRIIAYFAVKKFHTLISTI